MRFKAVCDIWSYSQRIAAGLCKQAGQDVKIYDDYQQMLADAKDVDAVIVATPDFWHADITNAGLKAGKHVYCEKEMSNDLEKARGMILTARQTGKLLQIGHQRRSNPYYQHAYQLMHKDQFCGDVRVAYGQWNQLKPLRPLPEKLVEKYSIPPETLAKWGYNSMAEFYEWRWFKKYSGGPMTDLGSHQLDVFNWFLDGPPSSVVARGGNESRGRRGGRAEGRVRPRELRQHAGDLRVEDEGLRHRPRHVPGEPDQQLQRVLRGVHGQAGDDGDRRDQGEERDV